MLLSRQSCRYILPIFSVLCVSVPAFARQKTGEIININQKYRIAFTDLTEAMVQPGDKVEVLTNDGKLLIFRVVEVYPVMVKLAVPADISEAELAGVSVGAKVFVVGGSSAQGQEKKTAEQVESAPRPVSVAVSVNDVPGTVETFSPSAVVPEGRSVAVKKNRPAEGAAASVQAFSQKTAPVAAPVGAVVAAAVPGTVPAAQEPPAAQAMTVDEKMDKLLMNNVNLSEHISRMLTEKSETDAAVKVKDEAVKTTRQRSEELAAVNFALETQVKALQTEVDRLKARNADRDKEVTVLNEKLTELKKKLARMVEIINKQLKSYE